MMHTAMHPRQRAAAQIASADYLPFGTPIRHDVIKLRHNGDYCATWRLEGICFETADQSAIQERHDALHQCLQSLGGGQHALWSHKVRRRVRERLPARFDNAFAQAFSDRYYAGFDARAADGGQLLHPQMVTELYLTLIYRPRPGAGGRLLKRLLTRSAAEVADREAEELDAFDDLAKQLNTSLKRYAPERLATFQRGDVTFSEAAAFLGFLTNGVWEDVPLRRASLSDYLPTSRLLFGDRNGMLEIWHPLAHKFAGFLDFQDYPKFSEPGMNNAILYGDYEYIETQSFSILNRRDAKAALQRQQGQLTSSEDASAMEIAQIDEAMNAVGSGLLEMGEYHYTLAVFGDSPTAVARNISEARTALQDGPGFRTAVIDAIPECAWFAQLPGNWTMRPREASITSRNFAALSPLHNFARGKRNGNPWGEALALLQTPSGQPFYFNHHVSADDHDATDEKKPGNTAVIGQIGTGKTTLVLGLMLFALKYPGLRGVFFDKDRGAEIAIRRLGGKYNALKRGEPTGFNPFQLAPTEHHIGFCERFVRLLAGPAAPNQIAAEDAEISAAVRTVMSENVHIELRRLASVWQNLKVVQGGNSVRDRLVKWIGNHQHGWAFDNPRDTQDFSDPTIRIHGYDYTEFLDDPEIRTPMMAYLLHVTESLIDGNPFIYWMEEFWKPLSDPYFADFAMNKQKTIRKQSGLGVFITQSPSDVLRHAIGKTMVEQSVTKIFLPNPSADHDDYVEGFKVTEQEFEIIRNLGEDSRLFLVKQGHRSAIVKFDLGAMPDVLNILSGSLDNVELLDAIRAELGDDPAVWEPELHKRIAARRTLMRH
ncbi:VirB4 family type IV secretion/conjugal transfer ATPase [Massilia sp. R2A-15]|uniref:VirB4 family type IV secretion/conjugal transfer ATPase n=1 Tax=Massilia sp. R2A-15 TaxID=3064278 RepID=UPI0027361238|nr:VirB4 family type IV secretion/conjugal transfer ATPase [Massilia sp. R2A-15]WLI91083.1 VirB4 family type IV secretion/conjugal transfer ATPase [Massilia sp. R2A-15]